MAEIEASEAVIQQQAENSLLVAVALHQATMMPELTAFFKRYAGKERNPIRKMAILYVTRWQRIWFRLAHGVTWPQNARFFDDYEKAKDWLVSEQF